MTQKALEDFVRFRITELRMEKKVSERKMGHELGKSTAYIRGITSGKSLPSLSALFEIMDYFQKTPSEFFATLEADSSKQMQVSKRVLALDEDTARKVDIFLDWIT